MVVDFATFDAGREELPAVVAMAVDGGIVDLAAVAVVVVVEADKRRVVSIALYQAGYTAIVFPTGHDTRRRSCGTLVTYNEST